MPKISNLDQDAKALAFDTFLRVMREVYAADSEAIRALLAVKVDCGEALQNHPQCVTENGQLSGLGLINGICHALTGRRIAAMYATDLSQLLCGFCAYTPEDATWELQFPDRSGFFIVDQLDRPCELNIAERGEDGLFRYIHPVRRDMQPMSPAHPTPVEDFGVQMLITGHRFSGCVRGESRAAYSDGRPRRWQGASNFSFEMISDSSS